MIRPLVIALCLCCAWTSTWCADLGLTVSDGVLMRDARPYRGIGVNYFDLFYRVLRNPDDLSSLGNLDKLARAGIPFVRFMGCGFWPNDMQLYLQDEREYWRRMDQVVRAAEQAGIGLIPSLFWCETTVPDLVGEHVEEYGNPTSRTVDLIRRYASTMVRRYRDSPAIWGWEFGNEYDLMVDLPNPEQHLPRAVPKLGTPAQRDERDALTSGQIQVAEAAFCQVVRQQDPSHRALFSGNSLPRPSAFHNAHDHSWKLDSVDEFAQMLMRDATAGFDTVTIHAYYAEPQRYAGGITDLPVLIALAERLSEEKRKPLFVGEFGGSRKVGDPLARNEFQASLDAIVRSGVPLAAFWVFDLQTQNEDWNVEFENDRSYQIHQVAEVNRSFHGPAP